MDEKNFYVKSGIVLVNKPTGVSSNKIVNIVKYNLKAKKCGHLGTLDLEGAGLLPVTVNNATKLFDYFLNKDKTYKATFIFGIETDTLDMAGEIIKQKECDVSIEDVEKACKTLIGKQLQMPPIYSAKKVGGKVAYKEARKGIVLDLKPKEIEIFDIRVLNKLEKNKFEFEIKCSSGTYIRSIARDLGEKMSTYGSMQCILRTRCGGFSLENSNTLEEIESGKFNIIPCDEVFSYENLVIQNDEGLKLLNGQTVCKNVDDGIYKIYTDEMFLGLGQIDLKSLKLSLRLI